MTSDGNYTCDRATRSGRDSSGENGDICLFCAVRVPTLWKPTFCSFVYHSRCALASHNASNSVGHRWWSFEEKKTVVDLFGIIVPVQQLWNTKSANCVSEIFLRSKFRKFYCYLPCCL